MSQSLVITNPTEILAVAKQMAVSNYFTDAKEAEQAFVKIMAGAELGLPPFQAMTGIHVINGKPVLGAGLIASIIKRSGKYNYRVTEQNDNKCSIDFYEGAELIGNSTFTIEMGRKAGVKNLDKFAQNMLFARAISNGAKWYTPDVFGGPVYTDGEIEPVYTAPVVEGSAEVVHEAVPTAEAKPRNAPSRTKEELANAMKAVQGWQNAIDGLSLTNVDDWNGHFSALFALAITNEEKNDLFVRFRDLASTKGFDYDKKNKVFYDAEPVTPAEEVPAQ